MNSVKKEYKQFLNTKKGAYSYKEFKNVLYRNKDTVVETVLNSINEFENKPEFSILDVGGGNGRRVIEILKSLHQKYGCSFKLDFIEQSLVFCQEFQRLSAKIEDFTEINIIHDDFENIEASKQYDLVLTIHSIFAFESETSLEKLLNAVSPDGELIVVSNSVDGFLGILKSEIDKFFGDQRFEINEVKHSLSTRSIFYKSQLFQTSALIDQEKYNYSLKVILEWLSLGHWKKIDRSNKEKVASIFEEYLTLTQNNSRVIHEQEELISIQGKSIIKNLNKKRKNILAYQE